MDWHSYIKIRNFDSEAGGEIFQGIGGTITIESGSVSVSVAPANDTPISSNPVLADQLWEGQNIKLNAENAYCDALQKQLKHKEAKVNGWRDKLVDVITEIVGEFLSEVAMAFVLGISGNPVVAWLSGILVELTLEWGVEALLTLLARGNALLDGIIDENNKLLTLEKSRESFQFREDVLARHREDIRIILEQIRYAEAQVSTPAPIMESKALLKLMKELDTSIDEVEAELETRLTAITEKLENMNVELHEQLEDIALRDATIDFGDSKLHVRGKVLDL